MTADPSTLREHALAIWSRRGGRGPARAAGRCRGLDFPAEWRDAIRAAPRVLVVGGGKAGAAMAAGLEAVLADRLDRVEGLVNVPEGRPAR